MFPIQTLIFFQNNGINFMTSANSTTVEQRWIKLRVPSRSESPKVKEFLAIHNYPVYHLERVPDDAQLLQGFIVHKYSSNKYNIKDVQFLILFRSNIHGMDKNSQPFPDVKAL
jgi:hypothetical protein